MYASASAAKASARDGNEGAESKGQAPHTTADVVAADCGKAPPSGPVTACARRALPEVAQQPPCRIRMLVQNLWRCWKEL